MKRNHVLYDVALVGYGLLCIYLCYLHAFPLAMDTFILPIAIVCIFCWVSWIFLNGKRKVFYLSLFIFLCMIIVSGNQLLEGFRYLYNQMSDVYAASDHYIFQQYQIISVKEAYDYAQGSILVVFVLYIIASVMSIYEHKGYRLNLALSFVLFVPTIMYRVPQSYIIDALLFTYWILLLLMHTLEQKEVSMRLDTRFLCRMVVMMIIFVFGFQLIYPPAFFQKNVKIEQWREDLETNYRQQIQKTLSDKPGEVDLQNAQNRYYFDTIEMKVSSEKPQDYYIKTFSGDIYEDNKWTLLQEEVYKKANIDWKAVYFKYDNALQSRSDHQAYQHTIQIDDKRAIDNYAPIPYDIVSDSNTFTPYYDAYIKGVDQKHYVYNVWDEKKATLPFQMKDDAYREFVYQHYLQVPLRVSSYFDALSLSQKLKANSIKEILAQVKFYIQKDTAYTLQPGATPKDQDFVRYFLEVNQKGYCVHYATTATLLLRYMGIPARYVEGYHVDKAKFDKDGDASVTDRQAHAWVEIYDATFGWRVVEVTPSSENNTTIQETTKPETPEEQQEETGQKNQENESTPVSEEGEKVETTPQTQGIQIHWKIWIPILLFCLCSILLLMIHAIRYKKWIRLMTQTDATQAVLSCDRYEQVWEPYGAMLSNHTKALIEKARFSQHSLQQQEYQVVYQEVMQEVQRVYAQLPWYKKLYTIIVLGVK